MCRCPRARSSAAGSSCDPALPAAGGLNGRAATSLDASDSGGRGAALKDTLFLEGKALTEEREEREEVYRYATLAFFVNSALAG